jgi:hypothetical protein
MFEMAYFVVSAIIAVGVFEEAVVPAATYTNEHYVKPAVDYTKEAVTEGVDYVKEKIN